MATIYKVAYKGFVLSEDVNQIVKALNGELGVPIRLDAVNDASNWALRVRNLDGGSGRGLLVQGPSGNTLLQVDKNGVKLSPDGVAAAATPLMSAASTILNTPMAEVARIKVGSYTGNGSNNRFISVGFTPSIVFLRNSTNVHHWVLMNQSGGSSLHLDPSTLVNDDNAIIVANGFRVSNDREDANDGGDTYNWVAIGPVS